jgi:hypothetical protein
MYHVLENKWTPHCHLIIYFGWNSWKIGNHFPPLGWISRPLPTLKHQSLLVCLSVLGMLRPGCVYSFNRVLSSTAL